jgi:hypothetical protein
MIAWLTFVFWLIQSLMFVLFFASSFTDLLVRLFVTLGVPVPETPLSAFLSGAMKALSWPVRVLFSSAWSHASMFTAILLLAVNSLIWGTIIGVLLFFFRRNQRRTNLSRS